MLIRTAREALGVEAGDDVDAEEAPETGTAPAARPEQPEAEPGSEADAGAEVENE